LIRYKSIRKGRSIIFVFVILTLVSSMSTAALVPGNAHIVFAKKRSGGSGSGSGGRGSNGDGTSSGGGSSKDNGGGQPTTGGSDNSNLDGDTGNTATPPPPTQETTSPQTCPDGSAPDANGKCPTATPQTCPDGSAPDANGKCPTATPQTCPDGSAPASDGTCPSPTLNNAAPQTLTQKTCPPLPIDANGKCPGIDMRGGGLGLPPPPPPPPQPIPEGNGAFRLPTVQPIFGGPGGDPIFGNCPSGSHKVVTKCVVDNVQCPLGTSQFEDSCSPNPPVEVPADPDGSCKGVFDPSSNKCYQDNFRAPPCPGGRSRDVMGFCKDAITGSYLPVVPGSTGQPCDKGVSIGAKHGVCFLETTTPKPDGSCQTGYFATGNSCSLKIHDPLPDGSCPGGYSNIVVPTPVGRGGTLCKLNELKLTNDAITSELPGGYCPTGYHHVSSDASTSLKCFRN
jgi:hypothetical protein